MIFITFCQFKCVLSKFAPNFFNKSRKLGNEELIEFISYILKFPPNVRAATHDIINTL